MKSYLTKLVVMNKNIFFNCICYRFLIISIIMRLKKEDLRSIGLKARKLCYGGHLAVLTSIVLSSESLNSLNILDCL